MNQTRAMARPFDDCLSCLLVFRLLLLTLIAVITTSTLVLTQPPAPGPQVLTLQAAMAAGHENACAKHYARWYDDFPSDSAKAEDAAEEPRADAFDARLPDYLSEPRPIRR